MNVPATAERRPPSPWPGVTLVAVVAVFALVAGGDLLIAAPVAVGGVVGSLLLRRRSPRPRSVVPLLPGVLAVAFVALTAAPSVLTDLFAGVVGLALLYWFAEEPSRAEGNAQRAAPSLLLATLAVGLAWAITLLRLPTSPEVGPAIALLAVGVSLFAVLLARLAAAPAPSAGPAAPPEPEWPFARRRRGRRRL